MDVRKGGKNKELTEALSHLQYSLTSPYIFMLQAVFPKSRTILTNLSISFATTYHGKLSRESTYI